MQPSLKVSLVALFSPIVGLIASPGLSDDGFIKQPSVRTQAQQTAQQPPQIIQQPSQTIQQPRPLEANGQLPIQPASSESVWLPKAPTRGIPPKPRMISVLELTPPEPGPAAVAGVEQVENTSNPTIATPPPAQEYVSGELVWVPSQTVAHSQATPEVKPQSMPQRMGQRENLVSTATARPPAPERPAPEQIASQPTQTHTAQTHTAQTHTLSPVANSQLAGGTPVATVPAMDAGLAEQQARQALSAQVTRDILASSTRPSPGFAPSPVDNPEGWQTIGQRLTKHMRDCEILLRRKAYYSARQDAEDGIRYLMQVLDQYSNTLESEPRLNLALQALDEADDFSSYRSASSNSFSVGPLVNSHMTDVLKHADPTGLSPLSAAAHYRIYAAEQLVLASLQHPWASELLYTLGRVHQAEAEAAEGNRKADLRWRAITYYRAAAKIDPQNALALNQMGFVFLQMDRSADAQQALVAAINAQASTSALANLMEACRRQSNTQLYQWAAQQHALLTQHNQGAASNAVPYTIVSAGQFQAESPRSLGPYQTAQNQAQPGNVQR